MSDSIGLIPHSLGHVPPTISMTIIVITIVVITTMVISIPFAAKDLWNTSSHT
jgi:hypothetical protein